jgi:putative Ca2+/H+ antiporter (TMEM165/GDT1 family)
MKFKWIIIFFALIGINCSNEKSQTQSKLEMLQSECNNLISATSTIFIAGFGDKSFLITAVMATKYNKNLVLLSATSSLILMGIISVQLGLAIPKYVPTYWIDVIAIIIFLILGLKMILDGITINRQKLQENSDIISNTIIKEALKDSEASIGSIKQEDLMPENKNEFKENLAIISQIFILIFSSELGDKSQISTIYLSSNYHVSIIYLAVIISQVVLTVIAIFFGRLIMGKISESNLTIIAGCLFIMFGLISLYLTYINDYLLIKKALHKYLANEKNVLETIPDKKLLNNFLKT